ncbi:MAG TPA: cbb3-type cytochrome c oxidase subunit 3 [Burkholderiales bacterium]|nr:cbb3-type cytochrome c oxidase subunit 3 [Burkholderiales bacterium]
MDTILIHSIWTVASLAVFLGIVWWAYAPSRRERFERDGQLPFEESEPRDERGSRR